MKIDLNRYTYTWRGDNCEVYADSALSADSIMAQVLNAHNDREPTEFNEVCSAFTYFQTK